MKTPDEIKKGLRHCSEDGCKRCPYEDECHISDGGSELAADALEYIRQHEAHAPRWISVHKRLPKDGQRVVAICENGMTGIMDYKDDGTPFAARILGHYFSNITYWYPLPEPPKGEWT